MITSMRKTHLLLLAVPLLAACSSMDTYKAQPGALKQAQMLAMYEDGVSLTGRKKLKEAVARFTEALAVDPSFVEAYIARGNAETELRMHKEALADFNKALELDPSLKEARDYLYMFRDMSVCHTALKQWDEVINDSNTMIDLYAKYPWAYMSRSIAYAALGRVEESKADDVMFEKLKVEFEKPAKL
jgi:tetratricopeptide (TPR) repeat protein